MEIQGNIVELVQHEDTNYYGVKYGFMNWHFRVVWANVDSDQAVYALDALKHQYRVGIRFDKGTNEMLGIWELE